MINIGSVDGIQVPGFETYAYSASKAAVHQLTRHLAKHLAPDDHGERHRAGAVPVAHDAGHPRGGRRRHGEDDAAQAHRPARGHGRPGDLPVVEGRRLHDRHHRPGRRRHRDDEVARPRPCPSSRRRPGGGSRPSTSPTSTASSPSAATSSRARSSPPTARACSRCRSGADGPMAWWSPDPRGVLPLDGAPPQPVAAAVDAALRGARRHARSPRSSRRAPTRAGPAAGSPTTSAPRTSGCTSSAGRTASRRGTTTGWPAGSTAWPSVGSSPASRCSTAAPTRRRWRSPALVDLLAADGDDRRLLDVQWATAAPGVARRRGGAASGVPPAPRARRSRAATRPLGVTRDLRARRRPPAAARPADLGPLGDQPTAVSEGSIAVGRVRDGRRRSACASAGADRVHLGGEPLGAIVVGVPEVVHGADDGDLAGVEPPAGGGREGLAQRLGVFRRPLEPRAGRGSVAWSPRARSGGSPRPSSAPSASASRQCARWSDSACPEHRRDREPLRVILAGHDVHHPASRHGRGLSVRRGRGIMAR